MNSTTWTMIGIGAAAILIPAARAVIKALRAKKSTADIVADALEAAVDGVDKRKK
jgi:hypothetical protein